MDVPGDTGVSPLHSGEEGIYYQARDPAVMAGLTKFSPGSINQERRGEEAPPQGALRGPAGRLVTALRQRKHQDGTVNLRVTDEHRDDEESQSSMRRRRDVKCIGYNARSVGSDLLAGLGDKES
ncbi:hypothetical protein WMY93_006063 [Mugilogobius chulae]|uniref:Uncharacterized protein n=1 Tax=Mugilogobius chulae TaxID=88201 RepID=A0AAW0PQ18_9GOBI